MSHDVECPYCGQPQEINHDDGYGYDEGRTHEQECGDCGKTFAYTTMIHFTYSVKQADCLNGAPHAWKPTSTTPRSATRWRCTGCDEHRAMSDDERAAHLTPEAAA